MRTEGKWYVKQHGTNSYSVMCGDMVLTVFKRFDMPEKNKANAYFTCKAVNSHKALLDALKDMVDCSPCQNGCAKDDMSCATRKAEKAIAESGDRYGD